MITLARCSLRHRTTAFTATFVSVLLGAALMGSFATLLETSLGPISAGDAETLGIMGGVVGSWGTMIVLFSVASTLSVAIGQRAEEIGLLRVVGATPRQVRRLVILEVLAVAAVAAGLGLAVAWPAGRAILSVLRDGGLVADTVAFDGGPASLGVTLAAVVATSVLAAAITARRSTGGSPTLAIAEARAGAGRMRWWRVALGLVLIGYGLATMVITLTVTRYSDDPYAAMSTSGASCIVVAVGLATLSPVLLRLGSSVVAPAVGRAGPAAWLASYNTARRAHLLSGVLAPVIVLSAGAIGVFTMMGIDQRTIGAGHPEGRTIDLLNNLVTGMIALFAAIMVINAFAAVVAGRRRELGSLRLLGATPAQIERSVLGEAALVAGVGLVAGSVASLTTIIPFSLARGEGWLPDGQWWLPPLLAAGTLILTLLAALVAIRRARRLPALAG
jgi:putative ABC transport system permease protein